MPVSLDELVNLGRYGLSHVVIARHRIDYLQAHMLEGEQYLDEERDGLAYLGASNTDDVRRLVSQYVNEPRPVVETKRLALFA